MVDASSLPEKVWPIHYDSRRQVCWAAIISVAVASVFVGLVWLLPRKGNGQRVPAVAAVVYGVAGLITCTVATASGRVRLTPTAILQVPMIGRTRWVSFADVQRVRTGTKSLVMEYRGGSWSLQWQQLARGGKRVDAVRDLVRGWLASDFEIALPQTGIRPKSELLQHVFGIGVVVMFAASAGLFQKIRVYVSRAIAPTTQRIASMHMSGLVDVAAILLTWVTLFLGLRWVVLTLVGIDLAKGEPWAYRRAAGHGFDVAVTVKTSKP